MTLTYSNLVDAKTNPESLAWYVNATNLPAAQLVTDAQAYIYGRLRTREMVATTNLVLAIGATTAPLPADFMDPVGLWNKYGQRIELVPGRNLLNRIAFNSDGTVVQGYVGNYGIFDEKLNFDLANSEAQTMRFLYRQRPAALAAGTNETNWITNRYPNMLRAAALFHAFEFRQDMDKVQYWKSRADELINAANAEADLVQFGSDFPVEVR